MTVETKDLEAAVEAILFASGEPVHIDRICLALGVDRPAAEGALQRLGDACAFERRGVRVVRLEDAWQLCSAPEYAPCIRRALEMRKPPRLSPPALEVLLPARHPGLRGPGAGGGQCLHRGTAGGPGAH